MSNHPHIVHNWKVKTFNTFTFCDHCAGLLWGLCSQGFQCVDCNFKSHSRCTSQVTVQCRVQQDRPNPGDGSSSFEPNDTIANVDLSIRIAPHRFNLSSKGLKKFCNYCRETTFTSSDTCYTCIDCRYVAHDACRDKTPSNCRITYHRIIDSHTLSNADRNRDEFNHHHWIQGNLKEVKPCIHCNEKVDTSFSLAHFKCAWCRRHVHSSCIDKQQIQCDFGDLAELIIPPSCISLLDTSSYNNHDKEHVGPVQWRLEAPLPAKALLIFVNSKSGGQLGKTFMRKFASLINPMQLIDLIHDGPDHVIQIVQRYLEENPTEMEKIRFLVCGGDGTVGWLLQALKKYNMPPIPIAIIPLGTGNDMSRSLGWGPGYSGQPLTSVLKDISDSKMTKLDTWTVEINEVEKESRSIVMNNYFSIGLDADIALGFHEARNANPHLFKGRVINKLWYGKIGLEEFMTKKFPLMNELLEIIIDGKPLQLDKNIQGIMIINVNNYAGGAQVVGVSNLPHLGSIISGVMSPFKLAQGSHIVLKHRTKKHPTTAMQVDGEPFGIVSSDITISFLGQVSMLSHRKFETKSSPIVDSIPVSPVGSPSSDIQLVSSPPPSAVQSTSTTETVYVVTPTINVDNVSTSSESNTSTQGSVVSVSSLSNEPEVTITTTTGNTITTMNQISTEELVD
ncbi:hypothetical protein SAMD00019534_095630 [Acytostelium subglobosum LB1]|uniref:hypothetical protein n=1 Tax=Acytostelium subglobosum LB1 TaxID=1410327 RepID=UPI00064503A4|nr:hypothetical protein SAMD00019534_095630 [Acytostelium subglobosum LB1]GAM26388.1 hypothetical protein SAMD00019534_095630 [Acytostelium subglobosum LB1]|eukprot:XP_012750484.1 hypothetical protein SAMD00019534_095630 [Acytostelium subglobosum LB1]